MATAVVASDAMDFVVMVVVVVVAGGSVVSETIALDVIVAVVGAVVDGAEKRCGHSWLRRTRLESIMFSASFNSWLDPPGRKGLVRALVGDVVLVLTVMRSGDAFE